MGYLHILLAFTAVLLSVQLVSTATSCQSPNVCGKGFCCRDAKNLALSLYAWKHAHYPLGPNLVGIHSHEYGTCTAGKAKKGELCDQFCECDTGLSCWKPYRSIYPPKICHDLAFIKQQFEKCKKYHPESPCQ